MNLVKNCIQLLIINNRCNSGLNKIEFYFSHVKELQKWRDESQKAATWYFQIFSVFILSEIVPTNLSQ